MKTITINTYDPAGRFNMSEDDAKEFFLFLKERAVEAGYEVTFSESNYVDEESEEFVEKCFQNY